MTPFEVQRLNLTSGAITGWVVGDERLRNWPVVYVLDGANPSGGGAVYVGETVNAAARMRQHLANPAKSVFRSVRVVIDDTFNKSACLDLESHLIRWLAGDGQFTVMNGNEGIIDARYYERDLYRESFRDIFEKLRSDGIFQRSIPEIENSDLFKLSPFKVLTPEQAIAVEDIVEGLLADLETGASSASVIEGQPGTGKTIIAIFLMKLLADVRDHSDADEVEPDSMFAEFFVPENRALLAGLRIGFVVPQQSLRESIKRVFKKTPKVTEGQILTPFDVGASDQPWDLLIVDETHRLNQRANQSSGVNNKRFITINEKLFGADDPSKTQLDWIRAQSRHQIYLLDAEQTVRPADLPQMVLRSLVEEARSTHRRYPLSTQMRVRAGVDYVQFVRDVLRGESRASERPDFGDYDLRFFDNLAAMQREIMDRNAEHGLARLIAGYAWEWKSNRDKEAFDIELDGVSLRWNSQAKDWINSPASIHEVGSIHTVQGYDLNYAGVIIGNDLRYDPHSRRLFIDRRSYRDAKGKENNKQRGIAYSDDDLLEFIRNIYGVLLTRGIRGTYVYVCDPALREYIAGVIGDDGSARGGFLCN
ncbi:DNA/RNA helicase domain-containing protein [Microbacterium sp. DT81.1]|uniref:DNA/RNA helicase domain-containing protein n=1 Tax=Microbacterium sp. DT81.1 TaxID=3393413 RepID=UPI003CE7CF4F